MLSHYHGQLLRLKGVVHIEGSSEPLIVQGSVGTLFQSVRMPARTGDDGRCRLVFITDGVIPELPTVLMDMLSANTQMPM